MADSPPPPPGQSELSSSDGSSRTTPPGTKRLIITLSVLFSFILGFPFLFKTTEIYRAPLPFRSIDSFANHLETSPVLLPCRFHVSFIGFSGDQSHADTLASSILREIGEIDALQTGGCGGGSSVRVSSVSSKDGDVDVDTDSRTDDCSINIDEFKLIFGRFDLVSGKDDDAVDEALELLKRKNCGDAAVKRNGGFYEVFVVYGDDLVRTVIGKHRHAWIVGKRTKEDAISLIGKIIVGYFVNGGKEDRISKEDQESVPVAADGSLVLSFSLLNANPNDWVYDWDFQKIEDIILSPLIRALAPVANISVESQVLYHVPKASNSYWNSKISSYTLSTGSLPFFVNSKEWHLDTSLGASGRSKVLQFAIYVPAAKECPLVLQLPNGEISKTNGFTSPMWGGVVVWNPSKCSTNPQGKQPARQTLSPQELKQAFEVFMGQMRLLFGLPSHSSVAADINVLFNQQGFTDWEIDVLIRRQTSFNLVSSTKTLQSLSKLVGSLPSMIVMDEIGTQVKLSLEASNSAAKIASSGTYNAIASSSQEARALAEDAFFHPSIMSLLYYPIEHHIAIYMPFFVPVLMHVILATVKEVKRYRQEKAKFISWKKQEKLSKSM